MSKAQGNMYDWVTETWNPVGGSCPIDCAYCFVKDMMRFPVIKAKYSGEPRLTGPWPRFGKGDVVFVCDMTDLFAMPWDIIPVVLTHCCRFGEAEYVFQTKVPSFVARHLQEMPPRRMIGTTVETDYNDVCIARLVGISQIRLGGEKTFVTIEPIMRFSPGFATLIAMARPSFVNIGADSKRSGLPEPTADEVRGLIADLVAAGIEVRQKPNLARLLKGVKP